MAEGYSKALLNKTRLAVLSGYWTGYFSFSKRPKPVKTILEKLEKACSKSGQQAPEVDVEAFLARERRYQEKVLKRGSKPACL